MPNVPIEARQRLFERVDVGGPNECWLWMGALDDKTYGTIGIEGDVVYVHRVVYNIYYGEIGDHQINHHCDIPNCVNPHHLYKGDQSDNIQEMWDRGQRDKEQMWGENNPQSKLSDEQAEEIKERIENGTETYEEIAEDYPITPSTVGSIAAGELRNPGSS